MFVKATRLKLRFDTNRGGVSVEQLWDMPLLAKDGFDLDTAAKQIYNELKALSEESFVAVRDNPRTSLLETKLEIVKYIIKAKQDEAAAAKDRTAKRAERIKLEAILATKQAAKLEQLSEEEIQKRLDELA